jgi:signal transduction histidine kinase
MVEVRDIVSEAVEQARPLADAHHHRIEVHMPPAGIRIGGDKKGLIQVISNLLNNAVKYTLHGGHIVFRTAV